MFLLLVVPVCVAIVVWSYYDEKREREDFRRRVTINLAIWFSGLGTIIPVGRRFEKPDRCLQLLAPASSDERSA
jgi:hypothetical protein